MAYLQTEAAQPFPVFWVSSCPQPIVAPLCFSADPTCEGMVGWPQSDPGFSMPSEVDGGSGSYANTSHAMEWAQVCMPFQYMTQQFTHCVVAPSYGSVDVMYAAMTPPVAPSVGPCVVPNSCSGGDTYIGPMCVQPMHSQQVGMSPISPQSGGYDKRGAVEIPANHAAAISFQSIGPQFSSSFPGFPFQQPGTVASSDDALEQQDMLDATPALPCPGVGRWADEPVDEHAVPSTLRSGSEHLCGAKLPDIMVASAAPAQQAMVTCSQRDSECDVHGAPRTCVQKWADWLVAQLGAGGPTRAATVANAYMLATSDKSSSRALQLALQDAPSKDAAALALGLRGHVRDIIWSMHGNYVLQKVIEVIPASVACFIVQELRGVAAEVARHRFGCRVLCRLLEHLSSSDQQTCSLVDEILQDTVALCRHNFGNFVIQHVLEFGIEEQKHTVACALCKDISGNARNQNASHAIEKALSCCSGGDRDAILGNLCRDPSDLLELAQHQFGCFVVRALLRLPQDQLSKVDDRLRPIVAQLGASNRRQRRIAAGAADRAARFS